METELQGWKEEQTRTIMIFLIPIRNISTNSLILEYREINIEMYTVRNVCVCAHLFGVPKGLRSNYIPEVMSILSSQNLIY